MGSETRLFAPSELNADDDTLSATLDADTPLVDTSLFLQLLEGNDPASLPESRIHFNLTIIGNIITIQ